MHFLVVVAVSYLTDGGCLGVFPFITLIICSTSQAHIRSTRSTRVRRGRRRPASFIVQSVSDACHVGSHLVLHFKDAMGESSVQVSVRNLTNAERVDHLVVCVSLQALELVNGDLSVVDRDEVDELFVLLDVYLELLDGGRVRVDIFLDFRLGLEETFESCLAQGHLLKLGLLVALLALSLLHGDLLIGTALHAVHHGLKVEQLTSKGHPCLLEWIAPLLNVGRDLLRQVRSDWVRNDALGAVAV